jgi:hypothetical protein
MMTKKDALDLAQRTANREGKPMAVLNLNPFNPLYVVREYDPRMLGPDLISIIAPEIGQVTEITTVAELLAKLEGKHDA